jgi:hypothetical protein
MQCHACWPLMSKAWSIRLRCSEHMWELAPTTLNSLVQYHRECLVSFMVSFALYHFAPFLSDARELSLPSAVACQAHVIRDCMEGRGLKTRATHAGCIGRAANDLSLLFRKSAQELSSAFTVWALRLTERCVNILAQDVLLPYALPMGLSAVMECVLQVMVYCSCLEDTHRVCLQPHLLRVLWPHIESAVESHVIRYS